MKKEQNRGAEESKRQQKLADAMENFNNKEVPQPQQQKKKNKWLMPLVLLIAIGIGVYLILKMSSDMGGDQQSFKEVFSAVQWQNALLAVGALLAILVLDSLKYIIVLHATTKKIRLLTSTKVSLLGRYYDNITPFASGGQPMQIYYLHKKGYGGGLSSAVIMIKYTFNITAWLLVALVCMACNTHVLAGIENGDVLLIAGWIGWGINGLLPVFILSFVLMPKFAKKLVGGIVHLGHKMKIVKDEQKIMKKAENVVNDFRSSFVIMAHKPVHLVLITLSCVAELALTFALPYFILKMLNGLSVEQQSLATMFEVMALNAYATFSASVVPTPGNSGALEGLLTMAFSSLAGSTLTWVVITWRFAVFYLYIIIGVGISIFNFVRNLVRERRAAKAVVQTPAQQSAVADTTPPVDVGGSEAVAVICDDDTTKE